MDLPKQRAFFEIFIERIKYLGQLALKKYPNDNLKRDPIVVYIILNDKTCDGVYKYFEENNYFGYETIRFYEDRAEVNLFDINGQIQLIDDSKILRASLGNGKFIK